MDLIYKKDEKWFSGKGIWSGKIIYIDGESRYDFKCKDTSFITIDEYLNHNPLYYKTIKNYINKNNISSMYIRYCYHSKNNVCVNCSNKCKHTDVYGCSKFTSLK